MGIDERYAEALVKRDLIDDEALDDARRIKSEIRRSLRTALLNSGNIEAENLYDFICDFANMKREKIGLGSLNRNIVSYISREESEELCAIPLRIDHDELILAVNEPLHEETISTLSEKAGFPVKQVLAEERDILKAIKHMYAKSPDSEIKNLDIKSVTSSVRTGIVSSQKKEEHSLEFDGIFEKAMEKGAVNIFFNCMKSGVEITLRNNAGFCEVSKARDSDAHSISKALSDKLGIDFSDDRPLIEKLISAEFEGSQIPVRASVIKTPVGLSVKLRFIREFPYEFNLGNIGISKHDYDVLKGALALNRGLILISGPPESGRSTTLRAIAREASSQLRKVFSIEESIDFILENCHQIDLGLCETQDFQTVFSSVLKHEADIVIIDQISDEADLKRVFLEASRKLIVAVVYGNSAMNDIAETVRAMGKSNRAFDNLRLIISQRLVERLCDNCKTSAISKADALNDIVIPHEFQTCKPVGCNICGGSGYRGHTAVFEALEVARVKGMLSDGTPDEIIKEASINCGFKTLSENALSKVINGEITIDALKSIAD